MGPLLREMHKEWKGRKDYYERRIGARKTFPIRIVILRSVRQSKVTEVYEKGRLKKVGPLVGAYTFIRG